MTLSPTPTKHPTRPPRTYSPLPDCSPLIHDLYPAHRHSMPRRLLSFGSDTIMVGRSPEIWNSLRPLYVFLLLPCNNNTHTWSDPKGAPPRSLPPPRHDGRREGPRHVTVYSPPSPPPPRHDGRREGQRYVKKAQDTSHVWRKRDKNHRRSR